MKKIRRKLGALFLALVTISSIVSFIASLLIRYDVILHNQNVKVVLFGFAMKDVVTISIAFLIFIPIVLRFTRRTADPIVELSDAAREVAKGNFDLQVQEFNRKDELGDLALQFNLMVKELQSNEYLKKEFISNVSHEFKTPLAIINGYSKLLAEDGITDEERKEYASLIEKESQRLSTLTTNMLKLSKLNTDTISIKKESFRLDEQIRQTIVLMEPKWSEKHLEFSLHLPPALYKGEADMLSEIWINLLDNAIKHSPDNGLIDISLISTQYYYAVYVRDQGEGIPKEQIDRVFDQFYQGDVSHKREGAGLGLSIASKIARLHGGSIECSSKLGKGTTFTVHLSK